MWHIFLNSDLLKSRQWSSVSQSVRELGVLSPILVLCMPYLWKAGTLLSFSDFRDYQRGSWRNAWTPCWDLMSAISPLRDRWCRQLAFPFSAGISQMGWARSSKLSLISRVFPLFFIFKTWRNFSFFLNCHNLKPYIKTPLALTLGQQQQNRRWTQVSFRKHPVCQE